MALSLAEALMAAFAASIFFKLVFSWFLSPLVALHNLRRAGFTGPRPAFPLGNLKAMSSQLKLKGKTTPSKGVTHDIHPTSLPYFASWQVSHGKVLVYWLGTQPFVYVADPEYLKKMAGGVAGKDWGKPAVFRRDREAMFGRCGLSVLEGVDWSQHRHVITPAFSSSSLKAMAESMVECTHDLINQWKTFSSTMEIDMEKEISSLAGRIIAKTNFGLDSEGGRALYTKLRAMQVALFKHPRYVGVPFGHLFCLKAALEARRLGKEVDGLLLSIVSRRREALSAGVGPRQDLLGLLLDQERTGKRLTTREIIDECKTFFFGGHETVALAMAWSLMLLALNPEWQERLREEISHVIGDKQIDFTMVAGLKKMGWVMNEVLRLYPSSPNAQRQAKSDIQVGKTTIPKGTNIWIDIVSMHHDHSLWGNDVHEFKPERFQEDTLHGGCKHKMGYLPFGFGGRMCIGRTYAILEYKIVLSMLLSRYSFSVSPAYKHCPTYFFSLRPGNGVPLIVQELS